MIVELVGPHRVSAITNIILIYFLFVAVSGYLNSYIKSQYLLGISHIRYRFMEKTKEKVMRVQYNRLEEPKFLNEFWRVISATSDIEFGIQGVLTQLFVLSANTLTSLFYVGIITYFNFWIIPFLAVNIYLVYLLRNRASKYEYENSKKAALFHRRQHYLVNIMGDFAYGKDIRIYGLSNFIVKKLIDNHQSKHEIEVDVQKRQFGADFAQSALSFIRDLVVYSYLIVSVLKGLISIADFTMCFMTIASLTITLEKVFEDAAFINNDIFRMQEMRNFLELSNEESIGDECIPVPISDFYELTFEHVSFRYADNAENIYTDFNFTIKHGKKIAIVGINGAGKTTLVKLIARLYEPTEGRILLNGIDISQFNLSEYRKLLTTVFQDVNLFALSLKENICCTDENFDEVKFRYAIEKSGLMSLYEKYNKNPDIALTRYLSDDGIELSGGYKQKVAIARALYKGGQIMIFDEPTAALDAYAEYAMYHQLSEITKNKTLIFISHRLASTKFCDEIVLIDHGQIIEKGSHEELMEKRCQYHHMFLTQKKYYEEGINKDEEQSEKGIV
jgi:ATP-binding cassette subfamily C protein